MDNSEEIRQSTQDAINRKRKVLLLVSCLFLLVAGGAGLGVYFGTKSTSSKNGVNGGTGTTASSLVTNPPTRPPSTPPAPPTNSPILQSKQPSPSQANVPTPTFNGSTVPGNSTNGLGSAPFTASAAPDGSSLGPTSAPSITDSTSPLASTESSGPATTGSPANSTATTGSPATSAATTVSSANSTATTVSPANSTTTTTATTPVPTTSSPTIAPVPTNAPVTRSPGAAPSPTFVLISSIALQGGAEFSDATSYQSKSVSWLENNANINTYSKEQTIQRYVLGCIFFSTNGVPSPNSGTSTPEWTNSSGWSSDVSECTWFGIVCNTNGAVTGLVLASNALSGRFPDEVTLLSSTIDTFTVGYDVVTNVGDELKFLGQLTQLTHLDLQGSYFENTGIPTIFGKLVNLVYLDVRFALFWGPLQDNAAVIWPNLSKLTYLDISQNGEMGTIPTQIATLPALEYFYAQRSQIQGDIAFIETMPVIFEFWMDENESLGGTIPSEIGTKATLGTISLSSCSFDGSLPTELGYLVGMQSLWLFNNTLTGTIPTELSALTDLALFQTEGNNLVGTMPTAMCQIGAFLSTDCASNEEVSCACCQCCTAPCNAPTTM